MKQKKRDVDPTRKVVAADTGTYRLGRNGRGGEETAVPTPPPPPPLLTPGIRDRERGERRQTEKEIYSLSALGGGVHRSNGESSVSLGGGAMAAEWRRKPKLCKAAAEWKHEEFCVHNLNVPWH